MNQGWRSDVRSWGRVTAARHLVSLPRNADAAALVVSAEDVLPVLGHGGGRSYGDVALNADGRLVNCLGFDRFLGFDTATGVLVCEAGVRLADILTATCRPESDGGGWFLPTSPGTRFVTVGGAIANDVHGKNHHAFGTFGCHVLAFDLARSDGNVLTCSPTENASLFAATIGGLGLTGLILRASIQMRRVPGLAMEAEDIRFGALGEFFDLAAASDTEWEYTAAWIDCLARGAKLGRGIFSRARHAPGVGATPPPPWPMRIFQATPPVSLANALSVRAFNAAYWRKLGSTGRSRQIGGYEKVLYPLDAVGAWNRVYGKAGFYQFQCVVPQAVARDAVGEILRLVAASGQGSMLSVLKMFGDVTSPGLLSFPMPGATLTLDFPNRGAPTLRLLHALEQLTIKAGGRLYPAKDGAMLAASMRAGYPELDRFIGEIDPRFSSSFARRVGILPASSKVA
jgi:FAD/FMN-containing dehydrogenase